MHETSYLNQCLSYVLTVHPLVVKSICKTATGRRLVLLPKYELKPMIVPSPHLPIRSKGLYGRAKDSFCFYGSMCAFPQISIALEYPHFLSLREITIST